MNTTRSIAAGLAFAAVASAQIGASAKSSAHRTFDGTIVHISGNNIKVKGMEGGKEQTLSFVYLPRVHRISHSKGKTTTAQAQLHIGQYVRVRFDQKLLGIRHADEVYPTAGAPVKM